MSLKSAKLRVGDWVEVRSREEILRTLNANGQLDGMPFMPEMFAFCGKRFQVYKSAHKTCDTVFPVRGRRVHQAVHLDTRCDGSAHGGCQASCLVFWKEAWLKPLGKHPGESGASLSEAGPAPGNSPSAARGCSEYDVWQAARTVSPGGEPCYVCQATRLPYATANLEWWDLRQYIEDYRSGNVGIWQMVCATAYFVCLWLQQGGIGLGWPVRWFWDNFYRLWGGAPFPRRNGAIPAGQPTPAVNLDLQPGELVRIKPYKEILGTLDARNRNRGLYFDAEEVPYCGNTYRVQKRVSKIIDGRTGKMREMKTPCVILDSVICQSHYSECRVFCPRSIYPYWREIWLERVEPLPSNVRMEEEDRIVTSR